MSKKPHVQYEWPNGLHDAFTGEVFTPRAHNHYEKNDGVPKAPQVETLRPTVRQRIENLLNRGVDPLANYVGHEGIDMEVPDDEDAPLTASEMNYWDHVAADLAERAPLPDEGLPRPEAAAPASPSPSPSPSPAAPSEAAPAASGAPAGGGPAAPVPTR